MNRVLLEATVTATGTTSEFNAEGFTQFAATLDVSAASGTTPTLDVIIQDSADGTVWNTLSTFTQKTAVSKEVIRVTTPFHNRIRAIYTITGTTPSFTASLKLTVK